MGLHGAIDAPAAGLVEAAGAVVCIEGPVNALREAEGDEAGLGGR